MRKIRLFFLTFVLLSVASYAEITYPFDDKKYAGSDAVVIFHNIDVDVEDSGLSHVNEHKLIKILTAKGAAKFNILRFDYDPQTMAFDVKEIKIHKKNGQSITLQEKEILNLPQPQRMIYWNLWMKIANIKGLEQGDSIEYKIYRKGFQIAYLSESACGETESCGGQEATEGDEKYIPPMKGHYYDIVLFNESIPVVEKTYTLKLPKDKTLQYETYNGEVAASFFAGREKNIYRWKKVNAPALADEKYMVNATDAATKVVLTTIESWEARSRWFFDINEPQFEFDSEIKEKTLEIIKGKNSDIEKITALLRWVAHNIRYSGLSMGKGEGYTIHPAKMIFHNRCGVCKDIAGMLITMLRAAGYETYGAMTMVGAKVERIPADQFNHCVVALKRPDGTFMMLDPTWAPFSRELWSTAEQEQQYLIGTPQGETLMTTPYSPPEENFTKIKAVTKISPSGDLYSDVSLVSGGYPETRLRRWFVSTPRIEHAAIFAGFVSKVSPSALISSFRLFDLYNLDNAFRMTFSYSADKFAKIEKEGGVMGFPLSTHIFADNKRLADYFLAAETKERKHPLRLICTSLYEIEEKILLPQGYTFAALPANILISGKTASFEAVFNGKGNEITLKYKLAVKKRFITPEEYPDFKAAVDGMRAVAKEILFLKKVKL